VAGGQHDAEVGVQVALTRKASRRGGDDADADDVDAGGGETGHDGRLEELAGGTGSRATRATGR
jgi:hypothetical protein